MTPKRDFIREASRLHRIAGYAFSRWLLADTIERSDRWLDVAFKAERKERQMIGLGSIAPSLAVH